MPEKTTPAYTKRLPLFVKGYDDEKGELEGFGAVMGSLDAYEEIIDLGAFDRSLAEHKGRIALCWQHDWHEPIGKPDEIREVGRDELPQGLVDRFPEATGGLYFKSQVVDTRRGQDAKALLRAGAIDELSIGYDFYDDNGFYEGEDGYRHLREIQLFEFSLVTMAAQPAAQVVSYKSEPMEGEPAEGKPYPNEHACRLRDPGDFQEDSFRRISREHEGKKYSVIMGRLTGETTMTEQAYRYPKDTWDAGEAGSHCEAHDGTFEAASEDSREAAVIELIQKGELREAGTLLQELIAELEVQEPPAVLGLAEEVALRLEVGELLQA